MLYIQLESEGPVASGKGLVVDGKWQMVSEQSFMILFSDSVVQSGEW